MYISCVEDAIATEAEMGYVPNNPLFGLPLDSPQVNIKLFKIVEVNTHRQSGYKIIKKIFKNLKLNIINCVFNLKIKKKYNTRNVYQIVRAVSIVKEIQQLHYTQ